MPKYNKTVEWRRTLRIARHECGHYVVARALGFTTAGITLQIDFGNGHQGSAAVTLSRSLSTLAEADDYISKRVQILFAGVLAESMEDHEVDWEKALTYFRTGASNDEAKARELLNLLRNIRFPSTPPGGAAQVELTALTEELWKRSGDGVIADRVCIHGLANRVASEVSKYSVPITISKEELDGLPAIIQRFGPPE